MVRAGGHRAGLEPRRPRPPDRAPAARAGGQGDHELRAHPARRRTPTSPSNPPATRTCSTFSATLTSAASGSSRRRSSTTSRQFLLELGQGFAFVGRQVHLEVGGDEFYCDLLFYHLRLRCFVVIELKAVDFDPGFLGQLGMYMAAVDDLLAHAGRRADHRTAALQDQEQRRRRVRTARLQDADRCRRLDHRHHRRRCPKS